MRDLDEFFMKRGLELAEMGRGFTNPNPMVGAVVVREGLIIAEGYHEKYGEFHAERSALLKINKDAHGATIYVTLEPCSHYGRTPPCVDIIIESGIKRCVVATLDPNPLVAGRGVKKLRDAGIEVVVGILEEEARELNKVFFHYIEKKTPYVFLKCAITLDGKIATSSGSSKWITNEIAREKVSFYRHSFMGVMVGKNTAQYDNPSLRCKTLNSRDPYRIVFDRELTLPLDLSIFQDNLDKKTIVITKECNIGSKKYQRLEEEYMVKFITHKEDKGNLKDILGKLGSMGIDSILLEGGESLISQFFQEGLIDGGEIFIAPIILGDSDSIPFVSGRKIDNIAQCIKLPNVKINRYRDNVGIEFKVRNNVYWTN